MSALHRVRSMAKRGLYLLAKFPPYNDAASSVVRRLNDRTFARLRESRSVVDVFLRGSFTRGTFTPFASDLDLALVLENDLGRTVDGVRDAMDALAAARRWNPSLRDWWQHVLVEDELAVVKKFWSVFGAEEWRRPEGGRAVGCPGLPDGRQLAFATWIQMCHWSASAFHSDFVPSDPIHSFEAGVNKTLLFSSRLSALNDGAAVPATADALAAFKTNHARLFSQDMARFRHATGRPERLRAVFRVLEAAAKRLNPAGGGDPRTLASADACFVVLPDGLNDADLDAAIAAARRRALPQRRWTSVLPASAQAIWPFPAARLLDLDTAAAVAPASPRAKEVYLFDTLFLPSAARLSLSFREPAPRLRRALLGLLRGYFLYRHGESALSPAAIAEAAGRHPDALTGAAPSIAAWVADGERPSPASGDLFSACSAVADRVHQTLLSPSA